MGKQLIVSISREAGSGGHQVAEIIAKDLGIKLYDKNILKTIAHEMDDVNVDELKKYDEKPRNFFLSRRVGKFTNSMEEILAHKEFDFIREKAESGESFVLVGRCGDVVLDGHEGLVKVFVHGDYEDRIQRVMGYINADHEEAVKEMHHKDKLRQEYYHHYTNARWGEIKNYDLSVNSKIGMEETAKVIDAYIKSLEK